MMRESVRRWTFSGTWVGRRLLSRQTSQAKHAASADPSKVYRRLSPVDHVLMRPEVYLGSIHPVSRTMWVPSKVELTWRILPKEVRVVPGFAKIFDEIVVNAADNFQRDKNTSKIDVQLDLVKNRITITNDGKGPPVTLHKEEKVYIPEMVFGTLLTGSNFSDSSAAERTTAGRHGYGAKLTNIMSKEFSIYTQDRTRKKTFFQQFSNNMRSRVEPVVETGVQVSNLTCVSFIPDLERFGMRSLNEDAINFMRKRVWDIASCLSEHGVSVTWNGERVPFENFKEFAALHGHEDACSMPLIFGSSQKRFEFGARLVTEREKALGVPNVSFVNSVATYRGGTHVNVLVERLVKDFGDPKVNVPFVRSNLLFFARATIDKPHFESQSKEMLTSKCEHILKIPKSYVDDVKRNSGLAERLSIQVAENERRDLEASSRVSKKERKHLMIPKLEDAAMAGKSEARLCTLIVTEGDSAKALAMAGLSILGRKHYGVYPIRGKILNVRDVGTRAVAKNEEIGSLVKILGLQYGRKYNTPQERSTLRYGKLMLMTDQDHDGHHIKALLINIFHHFWPSLLEQDNFLETFSTPIVKVKSGNKVKSFYDLEAVKTFKKNMSKDQLKKLTFKYYKGLGTSTREEARDYFRNMGEHRESFEWDNGLYNYIQLSLNPEDADESIDLVFRKDRIQDRRAWLQQHPSRKQRTPGLISVSNFMNNEVWDFSKANLTRSIPSVVDGMKPSQRKILYACLKKGLDKGEIKVSQLAGFVAEHTAYHHGENSIQNSIIKMAQNFVGSNNLPLLLPLGQFGTRLQGGDDAASPRYLFTKLSPLVRKIFTKIDDNILKEQEDDGQTIEPECFLPVIPMVLVNGAHGIGSAYATNTPGHDPIEIIDNIVRSLSGEQMSELTPFARGFTGEFKKESDGNFYSYGRIERAERNSFRISELPVGVWTETYRNQLIQWESKNHLISAFRENYTDSAVQFDLHILPAVRKSSEFCRDFAINQLQLRKSCPRNLTLFDTYGEMKVYNSALEILEEFVAFRLEKYGLRKKYQMGTLAISRKKLENQIRFARMVETGEMEIYRRPVSDILAQLRSKGVATFGTTDDDLGGYGYLLNKPLLSFASDNVGLTNRQLQKVTTDLTVLKTSSESDLFINDLVLLKEAISKELQPKGVLHVDSRVNTSHQHARSSKRRKGSKNGGKYEVNVVEGPRSARQSS